MPVWGLALLLALCAVRLPAVVQPLGPDQGIYAYVGQTILNGGLPYRDAWDQKPPGLHAFYALMWWVWPGAPVVAATDAALAWLVAWLLWRVAPRFGGSRAAGPLAAGLFLLLGDPAFSRLAGVRVRGQGEVFIGALVTLSLWTMLRALAPPRRSTGAVRVLAATSGVLLGLAVMVKYQAAVYVAPLAITALLAGEHQGGRARRAGILAWSLVGFILPMSITAVTFASRGALGALWDATVIYNLRYAGETYATAGSFLGYLVTFPVQHARVDALWLLGGAGSVILLARSYRHRVLWVPLGWTAAACLAIAINGSRSLPQYFLQAFPPLALSAALAADAFRPLSRSLRLVLVLVVAVAVGRVVSFPKAIAATAWDVAHVTGRIDRDAYLQRFAGRPGDKYSAPDVAELGDWIRSHSDSPDDVYVFGFSAGAYVHAGRPSASRFFWSMPVINRFNDGRPGYGPAGLLEDLQRRPPRLVALQRDDFGPGKQPDSRGWFLAQPALRGWLATHYEPAGAFNRYELWKRSD